jgi:signal transduction histidine kinase/HAMP domain-containing protein
MRSVRIISFFIFLIAFGVLVRWIFDSPLSPNFFPGIATVNPITAVCLIFFSLILLIYTLPLKWQKYEVLAAPFAIVILTISFLKISNLIGFTSFHLDQWLFASQVDRLLPLPGGLSEITSLSLLFLAISALTVRHKRCALVKIGQLTGTISLFIATGTLVSYFYTTSTSITLPGTEIMELPTVFALLLTSCGMLTVSHQCGLFDFLKPFFRFFNNRSTSTKITTVFLAIGSVITVISVVRSLVFYAHNAHLSEQLLPKLEQSYEMKSHAKEVAKDVYDYLAFDNQVYRANFRDSTRQFREALSIYQQFENTPSEQQAAGNLSNLFGDMTQKGQEVLTLKDAFQENPLIGSSAATLSPMLLEFDQANRRVDQFIDQQIQTPILREINESQQVFNQSVIFSSSMIIALLVLAVWFGTVLARWIIQPLKELQTAADQVAEGNLDIELEPKSRDEVGQLTSTFKSMLLQVKTARDQIVEEKEHVKHQQLFSQTILDHVPVGVLFIKAPEGKLELINSEAQQLFGVSDVVVNSLPYHILFHTMYRLDGSPYPVDQLPVSISLAEQKVVSSSDLVIHRPDGINITVKLTAVPIHNYKHELEAVVVVLEDVTKEREIDRMKNEFVSLASHQLRTPLTAMRWFSEMLLSGDAGPLNKEQAEFITNISESNDKMIDLVNSLLSISRIEAGQIMIEPRPTHLGELARVVIDDLSPQIKEKSLQLVTNIDPQVIPISIDPKLIRQVYLNLISNSIKYTPANGTITISITKDNGQIVSQISDTGYGIPAAEQNRIFSKFYRGANIVPIETEGTGLGLYLTKSIVDSSGGKIWFQSQEGKGTTFWFSLPETGSQPKKQEVVSISS